MLPLWLLLAVCVVLVASMMPGFSKRPQAAVSVPLPPIHGSPYRSTTAPLEGQQYAVSASQVVKAVASRPWALLAGTTKKSKQGEPIWV